MTIDVEWAPPELLADVVSLIRQAGIPATFFCTHAGVDAGGHERGLHPNFRQTGDTMKRIRAEAGELFPSLPQADVYERVMEVTHSFCPEAAGVRTHSLFYDSELLPIYNRRGLQYDASYFIPLVSSAPFWKAYNIVEFPLFYMDHHDLITQATSFSIGRLGLDQPGLRVLDFHPHMLYLNAAMEDDYQQAKPHYLDEAALLARRRPGRGVRTLFLDLLDTLSRGAVRCIDLATANAEFRAWHRASVAPMIGRTA
ncbi:MAG: hypothetical protein ACRD8O_13310 [Bryobacteraceae bacterium]